MASDSDSGSSAISSAKEERPVKNIKKSGKDKEKKKSKSKSKSQSQSKKDDSKQDAENDGSDSESVSENKSSKKRKTSPLPELEEEEEAISHKEKRKRRKEEKRAKQVAEDPDAPASKKIKLAEENKNKKKHKKSPYGVWVGNLAFKTTREKVSDYFKDCGTISRLHMPKGARKEEANRGFAYVDFETAEDVQKAVALSEGHLDGRRLLIKDASDFSGRPDKENQALMDQASLSKTAKKILGQQKNEAGPCLFIGNLSFNSTEQDIRNLIEYNYVNQKAWKPKSSKPRPKPKTKGESETEPKSEQIVGNDDDDDDSEQEESPAAALPENAGIRKLRIGTFEDSGKCKGWCFVDFETTKHATEALINYKNHFLDGRNLVVEFASAEAVRRGADKSQRQQQNKRQRKNEDQEQEPEPEKPLEPFIPEKIEPDAQPKKAHKPNQAERRAARRERELAKQSKSSRSSKSLPPSNNAQNVNQSILPSSGKKIVFD